MFLVIFFTIYCLQISLKETQRLKCRSCKLFDVSVELGFLLFCSFIKNGDQGNIENKLLRIIFDF